MLLQWRPYDCRTIAHNGYLGNPSVTYTKPYIRGMYYGDTICMRFCGLYPTCTCHCVVQVTYQYMYDAFQGQVLP